MLNPEMSPALPSTIVSTYWYWLAALLFIHVGHLYPFPFRAILKMDGFGVPHFTTPLGPDKKWVEATRVSGP